MDNERRKRFLTAFNYLRQEGIITSQKDLVEKMDANKATISSAMNGRDGYLTDKFLYKFNNAVGNIFDIAWLLSGHGTMLPNGEIASQMKTVPVIPLSAVGGSLRDIDQGNVTLDDCETMHAPVNNAEYAISVYGDSMEPTYPSGCRVFIRRIDPSSFISWGSVFVLDTVNGIYIKEVQKGSDEAHITCVSHNPTGRYPTFEIPLCDIFGMYRVLASITVTQ